MLKQKIRIKVFDVNIIIMLSECDNDIDQLNSELRKIQKKYNVILDKELSDEIDGLTFRIDSNIYIMIAEDELSILMHELYHCISFIYEWINLPMNSKNDEFWAYIMSYLVKQIYLIDFLRLK